MSCHYSIEIDKPRCLVRIRMGGLFTRKDIAAFIEARREAHEALDCPPNAHSTLNDLREMKIQPAETVEAFRDMLSSPAYRSRRLAFVVGPTLTRNQLMRAAAGRDVRWFEDPALAEAWLLEEDEEAEEAPPLLRRTG
jgi:hypothetical protein